MAGVIAAAVLVAGAYSAYEGRKARQDAERQQQRALQQQRADAEAMRTESARAGPAPAPQGIP